MTVASFTANGQVQTLKDANSNLTNYEYDGFDRLIKTQFPVGTAGANASSQTDYELYGYDAAGNVTSFRTRRGETLTMSYDNLDRLTVKVVPERSGLSSDHTRDVYFGYDLFGNLTYARYDGPSGDGIANAFDALGRQTATTATMDGQARTLGYAYDASGNRTQVSWPDATLSYVYDAVDRLDYTTVGSSGLRKTIEQIVGADTCMSNLIRPVVIPAVNLTKGGPKVFKLGSIH